MSLPAMTWAFDLDIRPSSLKFLLVSLADNAGSDGKLWPSIETIAHKTSMDRKTVIRGLDELERIGFLTDTLERVGRTKQVKVYTLTGFDIGQRHYVYRIDDPANGEFYIGVRTCQGNPNADTAYMGSGTWPLPAMKARRHLKKTVLALYSSRQEAESAERLAIEQCSTDPNCMNRTNFGTVQTVPLFPANSTVSPAKGTVFPSKGSQKRYTESSLNPQEPSDTHTARAREADFGEQASREPPEVPRETQSEVFEHVMAIKAVYPKAGREDWITAEHRMRQIVSEGGSWVEIEAGVARYALYCKRTNRLVQNPANFFTAIDRPWLQEWAIPDDRPQRKSKFAQAMERLDSA